MASLCRDAPAALLFLRHRTYGMHCLLLHAHATFGKKLAVIGEVRGAAQRAVRVKELLSKFRKGVFFPLIADMSVIADRGANRLIVLEPDLVTRFEPVVSRKLV